MLRLIAFAAFALAVATSAQAMPRVPLHQPDGMTTQVRYYGYGHRRYGYGGYRHYGYRRYARRVWALRVQALRPWSCPPPSAQVRGVGRRARLP